MSDFASFVRTLPPLALIVVVGVVYARGRSRLGSGSGHPPQIRAAVMFYLGLASLLIALSPPLDHYSDHSLSAHMSQHVILMIVAPLLLVLADPWRALVAGLPGSIASFGRSSARSVGADSDSPEVERAEAARPVVVAWAGAAIVATVVQGIVMWVWHVPALYDLAVRVDAVHAVEHLSYLGAGIWFWWTVGASGARSNAIAALVVFVAALPCTALGAALMLAPRPWFPLYADLPDQQLSGAIMWAVGGAVYLVGAVVLFLTWLNRMDSEDDAQQGLATLTPRNT